MRFAYADPPYLGQGRLYREHPDSMDWNDPERHRKLVQQLMLEYPDGWALSATSNSLRTILPFVPERHRVAAWVKPFCAFKKGVRPCYAWEPVIFVGGRNPPVFKHAPPEKGGKQNTPKDFLSESITLKKGLTGAKPSRFCHWILDLLNFQPGDEMSDLFPGTGIMGVVSKERS